MGSDIILIKVNLMDLEKKVKKMEKQKKFLKIGIHINLLIKMEKK